MPRLAANDFGKSQKFPWTYEDGREVLDRPRMTSNPSFSVSVL